MTKKLTPEESKFYRKYHIPNCGNFNSVKIGAIFLNKHNTRLHEDFKVELAWEHEKYITEASRSATDEERILFKVKKDLVLDFVDIKGMKESQVIHKHETDEQIKYYRDNGIFAFVVGEFIICSKCKIKYPKRNNKGICQICLKEMKE